MVVGGPLAQAGEILLEPLREAMIRRALPSAVKDVTVVASELDVRAELLGAIALVLRDSGIGTLALGASDVEVA